MNPFVPCINIKNLAYLNRDYFSILLIWAWRSFNSINFLRIGSGLLRSAISLTDDTIYRTELRTFTTAHKKWNN